jgi:hypothetical protein
MLQQGRDRPAVSQPSKCGRGLAPHLVTGIIEASDQYREGTLGPDLTQYVGGPGSRRVVGGIIQ